MKVADILNKRKKPVKISGKIIRKIHSRKYVIQTRTGVMSVESTSDYSLSEYVVAYDGIIQGKAGESPVLKTILV